MEKMICVPLCSKFDIKCPTGQPRILISSHYDCPTFIRLSVSVHVRNGPFHFTGDLQRVSSHGTD